MPSLSRRRFAIGGLGFTTATLAGTRVRQGYSQGSSKVPTFRIGVATWVGYGAIYVAKEKGLFRGIDVDIQRSDDPNVFNAAMLRGDVDGYCTTLDNFVVSSAGGLPGNIIYLFDESAGSDGIVVRQGINSLGDLRGKQVAAQAGFPGHFFLLYLMARAGVSQTEYNFINLDSEKAGAAFASGRLDAAVTWEPWLSQARDQGKGKILVTTREHPGIIVDALIGHPNIIRDRPEVVRALVTGLVDAVEFWKANPAEADVIVGRSFSLRPEEVSRMAAGVRYLDRDANRLYLGPQGRATETLSLASQVWRKANLIEKVPDMPRTILDSFVK